MLLLKASFMRGFLLYFIDFTMKMRSSPLAIH